MEWESVRFESLWSRQFRLFRSGFCCIGLCGGFPLRRAVTGIRVDLGFLRLGLCGAGGRSFCTYKRQFAVADDASEGDTPAMCDVSKIGEVVREYMSRWAESSGGDGLEARGASSFAAI
jgi:hypothetical protein